VALESLRLKTPAQCGFDELVIQLVPGHESAIEDRAKVFDLR
jgi:hypothetical protein